MSYTIIITASYIPSHPSIKIIKETIESLKYINMDENTLIILAHDYNNNPNYYRYFQNLSNYIKNKRNIKIICTKVKGHLTGNIRNAFSYVNTKYVLIIQHDLPFISEFYINDVIEDMENYSILKHVRFNKRNNVKLIFDSLNNLFGAQLKAINYIYTRTPGWSDNNHLCRADYYRNIVLKECKDGKPMESYLHGLSKNEEIHYKYGTFLFGPLNHKQMIKHTDGRNTL
jgi:hypothetical protein